MSYLWEKEGKKERERKEGKRNRKGKEGKKEGRRNKKRKKDRTEGEKRREKKDKEKSSAGFKLVRLVLLVFLSVKWKELVGGIGFTFLPS